VDHHSPDRNSYDENIMSKWNGYGEFISQADPTGGNPSNVYFKTSNNRSRKKTHSISHQEENSAYH
jgi:hypothetical protein